MKGPEAWMLRRINVVVDNCMTCLQYYQRSYKTGQDKEWRNLNRTTCKTNRTLKRLNSRDWSGHGWWWDGCVGCRWRIGNTVWICTVFWVYRAWLRWCRLRWDLGMWSVGVWMIGYRPVERWRTGGGGARCKGRKRKTWYECVIIIIIIIIYF